MKLFLILLGISTLSMPTNSHASDIRVDFWAADAALFGVAKNGQYIDQNLSDRRISGYSDIALTLDHNNHVVGDFSFRFSPHLSDSVQKFGFVSGLWGETWSLDNDYQLSMSVSVKDIVGQTGSSWTLVLMDDQYNKASLTLKGLKKGWNQIKVSLSQFDANKRFNWAKVNMLEFEVDFAKKSIIWIDGVGFSKNGQWIGVTDKTITQRIKEAQNSKATRVKSAFALSAKKKTKAVNGNAYDLIPIFAKMYLGEDLKEANQTLMSALDSSTKYNTWSLLNTPLYLRFYFLFSSKSDVFPGRLTAESEQKLLDIIWSRTMVKNDIHIAKQSTWWMHGSENHDLNAKASSYLASLIFMNEPDYKDKILPSLGFGGGAYYGRAGYYGQGINTIERAGSGRANLATNQEYVASDLADAWAAFFKEYFAERAKRGFFLEYGSPGYSKHSLGFIDLVYQHTNDQNLKSIVRDFLTLNWADWAHVSISGYRGGPKTRHHKTIEGTRDLHTAELINTYMGAPFSISPWNYWNPVNDYELPSIIWRLALDKEGLGKFVYRSRGIGEEQNLWPRPLGTERALITDTQSRFLKYTYVTPTLTLGTQMDHPAAVHSHLSIAGRWHGMTVAGQPKARIVPVGVFKKPNSKGQRVAYDTEVVWHTVQHENTLIVQKARRWFAVHPTWFPAITEGMGQPAGIWFGNDWDQKVEKDGWIFARKGIAFVAVRPVHWDKAYDKKERSKTQGNQIHFYRWDDTPTVKLCQTCYSWNTANTILQLPEMNTPVIIEVSELGDHVNFEAFVVDVLNNPIALYRTVVPGYQELVYTGSSVNAKEIVFNAGAPAVPKVGNKHINYEFPKTYDSPFIKSDYLSGVVNIQVGDEKLVLDFVSNK